MIKYTCGAGTPEEAETNCTYFVRGECTASFCEYRRKKQTNADIIRAMSDEELAGLIRMIYMSEECPLCTLECETCFFKEVCAGAYYGKEVEWLQKPAE